MSDRYRIVPSVTFAEDLERLEEHIIQRELANNTPDEACLLRFQEALEQALGILSFAPHTCRRCQSHRAFRELIVPFGNGGCVVLFTIRDFEVVLLAARDQHENDYR